MVDAGGLIGKRVRAEWGHQDVTGVVIMAYGWWLFGMRIRLVIIEDSSQVMITVKFSTRSVFIIKED